MSQTTAVSPFTVTNVKLYVLFRIFFNARFYYPIFTILFIDFGLTVAQFAILNSIWAATIVLAEVPSGALADTIGRRKLLRLTGWLMIFEISLLAFAPRGNPQLLFIIFSINRILSGLAEAAASGADEALAYDSLKSNGMEHLWGSVLESQMRWQSLAFVVAMMVGAAVYDPAIMQTAANWLGIETVITQDMTLRIPLFLTLAMALVTLFITHRFKEPRPNNAAKHEKSDPEQPSLSQAFQLTFDTGRWILKTHWVLVIIAAGFVFDGIARVVITLSSQYYRVIELPEASYGLIGAGVAMLGLVIPRIARRLSDTRSIRYNFGLMVLLSIVGLAGMNLFIPYNGIIPAVILFSVMYFNGFFISDYLNRMTESSRRATVLSFKGLSYNLAYGILGILYSILLAATRPDIEKMHPGATGDLMENLIFVKSFIWFPITLLIMLTLFILFALWRLNKQREFLSQPVKNNPAVL